MFPDESIDCSYLPPDCIHTFLAWLVWFYECWWHGWNGSMGASGMAGMGLWELVTWLAWLHGCVLHGWMGVWVLVTWLVWLYECCWHGRYGSMGGGGMTGMRLQVNDRFRHACIYTYQCASEEQSSLTEQCSPR